MTTIFPPQFFFKLQGELPFCTGIWDSCGHLGWRFLSHFFLQHPVFSTLHIHSSRARRAQYGPAKTAPLTALHRRSFLKPYCDGWMPCCSPWMAVDGELGVYYLVGFPKILKIKLKLILCFGGGGNKTENIDEISEILENFTHRPAPGLPD